MYLCGNNRYAADPPLGWWVRKQRRAYVGEQDREAGRPPCCTHRISPARIRRLHQIGFEWTVKHDVWDERFAALRQFVQQHGHARVPAKFPEDPALGMWVDSQRRAYVRACVLPACLPAWVGGWCMENE